MKILIPLLLITILTFSCKKDENSASAPKLKNCNVGYLFFIDDINFTYGQSLGYPPVASLKYSYVYEDDNIAKEVGGFIRIPSGQNFSHFIFSNDAYDSIIFSNNTIYSYAKYNFEGSILDDNLSPTIYNLDSQQKLIKINKRDDFHPTGIDLNYTYSGNIITESDNNGITHRKFYIENNNLVKVVTENPDMHGVIVSKKEILFQDFDNNPNPFKNKYFIKGAFFRAFSANNYQKYTINKYSKLDDGTFGIYESSWFSMPIKYNAAGYPLFGDYE